MVENSRTATGTGALRTLNEPQEANVMADRWGEPRRVAVRGGWRNVVAVVDRWRIDDEWWREEISRRYFVVELQGGKRQTLYEDLAKGGWYSQPYYGPWTKRTD